MATIEQVRKQIQRTLEHYFTLEEQLKLLEQNQFRVCIFGSARIRPEHEIYRLVYQMAHMLTELNIDIVTGGGPGLMEAANQAVRDAHNERSKSIGLPIHLPASQELANRHLDIKSEHKRFSSRLDEFMRLSHAVIVAPGGIGTLLELMYVWQLLQVGMIEPRPVILLDRSMWSDLVEWMKREMLGRNLVSGHDFNCIYCVDTAEEVLPYIKASLERFKQEQLHKKHQDHHTRAATEAAAETLAELERRRIPTAEPLPNGRAPTHPSS